MRNDGLATGHLNVVPEKVGHVFVVVDDQNIFELNDNHVRPCFRFTKIKYDGHVERIPGAEPVTASSPSVSLQVSVRLRTDNSCHTLIMMKVLLVEDSADIRDALRAMIQRLGHHVVEATDGKEAVQATIDHNPDCVLMDLALPAVDGLQATAAIRAISRFKGRLPIIAITAFPESLSQDKAFKAGCDGYLRKPIDPDTLREAFKRICGV